MDFSPGAQLHRLGQEMEKIFTNSYKAQFQRDLTEEEVKKTQIVIYGTVPALQQHCAPPDAERPPGAAWQRLRPVQTAERQARRGRGALHDPRRLRHR